MARVPLRIMARFSVFFGLALNTNIGTHDPPKFLATLVHGYRGHCHSTSLSNEVNSRIDCPSHTRRGVNSRMTPCLQFWRYFFNLRTQRRVLLGEDPKFLYFSMQRRSIPASGRLNV
ncbi:hypothetical protein BC826DRAFT_990906 [Russula brevipes]|nr:hypothetical protein BC826DRAFT_990906 [Russula brevipes]